MSNKDATRVMLADFGATLDLGTMEKGNCGVDNHAVICALLVARGWRQVARASSSTGMSDVTVIDDCGKWVIFGDTMSKGGENDHVFHNACLDYVISFYDNERSQQNQPRVRSDIAHTDNCASQCKCRQNFFKIASFGENHGQNKRIIHKFASKHGFKGPWDATGKVVKEAILRNECKFERCSNATDCCFKLSNDMNEVTNPKQHSKWIQWETEGDEKVLKNTTYKNKRTLLDWELKMSWNMIIAFH